MSSNILVRDLPVSLSEWLDEQAAHRHVSRNRLIHQLLDETRTGVPWQPGLFDAGRATTGGIPFTFIDLFAGIGGFRIAMERLGGRCVFTSERDRYCQRTYQQWFGDDPDGDINAVDIAAIPDHDVLTAGFPCQPFSLAGVSKKNSLGRAHGFHDQAQGTLFFRLAEIIEQRRPSVLLLENVKHLKSHDRGRTWKVIEGTLEDLDYTVHAAIIDACHWVPQHRERIYIVAFDRHRFSDPVSFSFPEPPMEPAPILDQILEDDVDERYTLSDRLWNYLQAYRDKHRSRGNGFGFSIADPSGRTRTLSARYHKDGSEILIGQPGSNPRRLTPREAARLMGYPEELPIVVSNSRAYQQFGNAVVPAVVEAIGAQILRAAGSALLQSNGCLLKRPEPDPC